MNFLSSLANAAINASSAALHSAQGGIPGVPGYLLGDRVLAYEGKSIWSLWSGTKKDDQTPVTVFSFDLSSPSSHSSSQDRRALLPLARNALRKLRALRHPNILKFLDGSETDSAVWIVTEPVRSLAVELEGGGGKMSEEAKVYGLLHVCTALGFLNRDGQSVHGGLRTTSVWITPGGEFKLGGMEVCSRLDEADGTMWNYGGLLPDSRTLASPEVRRGGWTALKEYDPSTLDSYLLHLFLYTLFVGPLPSSFLSPSSPSDVPSLPQTRPPTFPTALHSPWRRLGAPNPAARLKTSAFLELGQHPSEGWWPSNRLVKLSAALEGFALASENERAGLIRTLKAISAGAANAKTDPLPAGFLKSKVLPSLVHSFEFGGGAGAAQLLPVILGLAGAGEESDEKEYQRDVVQPIVRMYATPDRAVRMALLENLEKYVEKVSTKDVCERVWPHLMTGFGDVVPVIREATVKSILLIAPKLNDRILNNDLLRHLSKTQTDTEPGIRTNTCILLSRLSRHLNTSTQRKVLIPAFARALRDPFVHARIAGLMALMATAEVFEKEDLAGKVIPAMSICLVDREKIVRDQAFKAIDMFVKKCEALTASMPETALPPIDPTASPSTATAAQQQHQQQNGGLAAQAAAQTQPAIASTTSGAAGALAGWAFASVSKKLSSAELAAPIERRDSSPSISGAATPNLNGASGGVPRSSTDSLATPSLPGGFEKGTEDWGGDLIDVENDDADWNEFESGQAPQRAVDPLAARLSATKPKPGGAKRGGALKLGAASRSSALRVPMDMDASDSWDLDEGDEAASSTPSTFSSPAKPKSSPIPRAAAPSARINPIIPAGVTVKKPTAATASLLAAAAAPPPPPPQPAAAATPRPPPIVIEPSPAAATSSPGPPASQPPSPLPPAATPPLAPIPPSLPTVAAPPPVSPGIPPSVVPLPVSPASSAPGTPTLAASTGSAGGSGGSMAGMSKEEKAAALARAREERKRRMAEAKAKR